MEWEWPGSNRKIIEKWPSIGQAMGKKRKRNGWEMGKNLKWGMNLNVKFTNNIQIQRITGCLRMYKTGEVILFAEFRQLALTQRSNSVKVIII